MDIFAHRGVSAHYPENTRAAFLATSKLPITGVEFDVHLITDGELVVIHDETINRTSNGTGYVRDYTLHQLRAFEYGSWFSEAFVDETILTLGEVLELFKGTHHVINIELKTDVFPYEGIELRVIKEIAAHQMTERVIISSFNHESIQRVSQLAPYIESAALFEHLKTEPSTNLKSVKSFHVSLADAFSESVEMALEEGRAVRVYTVNEIDCIKPLQKVGVQAIFTDDPEKLIAALDG